MAGGRSHYACSSGGSGDAFGGAVVVAIGFPNHHGGLQLWAFREHRRDKSGTIAGLHLCTCVRVH
jgi:hypothetical protein